jgi:hypothetical protein
MPMLFSANSLEGVPKSIKLTGGLFDRLKGMSAYLRLCEFFDVTPVVIWDSPFHFSELFELSKNIVFVDRKILYNYPKINWVNLLNQRGVDVSLDSLEKLFRSESCSIMFCNKALSKGSWVELYKGPALMNTGKFNAFLDARPDKVLFRDYKLTFRKPEKVFFDQKKARVTFHLRVGGVQDLFTDPCLADSAAVVERAKFILQILRTNFPDSSIEVGISGDSTSLKAELQVHASMIGFSVISFDGSVTHVDRTPVEHVGSVQLLLSDIDLISSSNFVFVTSGAFGLMSAKYRNVPVGKLFANSSLDSCLQALSKFGDFIN